MKHDRYPRTLNEAFGPYTSRDFVQTTPTMHKVLGGLYAVAIVGLLYILWKAGVLA